MHKTSHILFAMVVQSTIVLFISKITTGALNPLEVFHDDSLLPKFLVGFFLISLFFTSLQLIFSFVLRDETCIVCSHPLVAFASVYGAPVRCNFCSVWYHTLCLKKAGGSAITGCRQGDCPSARGEELLHH